ncbi:MAG: hypothetical protein ACYDCO_06130 [Armatimonadota bacterium]
MSTPEEKERAQSRTVWGCVILALLLLLLLSITHNHHPSHRKAREYTLRANLHQIRNAIDAFKTDTGVYPAELTDLSADDGHQVKAKIKPGSYKGPYLCVSGGIADSGLPVNPLKYPSDPDYQNLTAHWRYDANTGKVHSNITTIGKDVTSTLEGIPYSEL